MATRRQFLIALKCFEDAAYDKAFEGTIPYDSDGALQEHDRIDREYEKTRNRLIELATQ